MGTAKEKFLAERCGTLLISQSKRCGKVNTGAGAWLGVRRNIEFDENLSEAAKSAHGIRLYAKRGSEKLWFKRVARRAREAIGWAEKLGSVAKQMKATELAKMASKAVPVAKKAAEA